MALPNCTLLPTVRSSHRASTATFHRDCGKGGRTIGRDQHRARRRRTVDGAGGRRIRRRRWQRLQNGRLPVGWRWGRRARVGLRRRRPILRRRRILLLRRILRRRRRILLLRHVLRRRIRRRRRRRILRRRGRRGLRAVALLGRRTAETTNNDKNSAEDKMRCFIGARLKQKPPPAHRPIFPLR